MMRSERSAETNATSRRSAHGHSDESLVEAAKREHSMAFAALSDLHAPNLSRVDVEDLIRRAHALCPYSNATRGNVDVTLRVDGTPLERPAA